MTIDKSKVLLCQMYLPQFDEEEKQALTVAIEALEELKEYKLKEFQCHLAREEGISIGYNKAVDDFAEALKKYYQCYDIDLCLQDNDHFSYTDSFLALESYIDEIAQQLKTGGTDGSSTTNT